MEPKTESRNTRQARMERGGQAVPGRAQQHVRPSFWLVLQGDVVDLIESSEQPDIATKKGERRKMIAGAFTDRDKATAAFSRLQARARGIVGKQEAR